MFRARRTPPPYGSMNCPRQPEIHVAPDPGERIQRISKRNFEGDENDGFGFDGCVSC
jgi:hypothetical protein